MRLLQPSDLEALGELMWEAYCGTIDDEYKEPDDARIDASQALAGWWGPLIGEASLAATADGRLIAAVVTVRDDAHNMILLLAYVLTAPKWQRRGVASWLVAESAVRLAALDIAEVHLAVTRGNPAERVYQRLGFRVLDSRSTRVRLLTSTGAIPPPEADRSTRQEADQIDGRSTSRSRSRGSTRGRRRLPPSGPR